VFQKSTVRAFSIVAIVLASIGLLLSVAGTLFTTGGTTLAFLFGLLIWGLLLWAAILGYKLTTSYKLYDEEYKKVGIRIYAIIIAFFLFFFVGLIVGLAIAVIILATLWGLKRNYDEWDNSDTMLDFTPEDHS
jgi:hypothetical protein